MEEVKDGGRNVWLHRGRHPFRPLYPAFISQYFFWLGPIMGMLHELLGEIGIEQTASEFPQSIKHSKETVQDRDTQKAPILKILEAGTEALNAGHS